MKFSVKVRDIAARAGVSVGTVSNVLNGRKSVKEALRARVLSAMDDLGYSANLLAKSMRAQRYPAVGLCVPHATISGLSALLNALEERASDAHYEVMQVLSHGDPERELFRIQRLVAVKISGVILLPSFDPSATLDYLFAADIPTVLVSRAVADDRRFDQVAMDNLAATHAVLKRIVELGHRRILFVYQYPHILITEQRIAAFNEFVRSSQERVSCKAIDCGASQTEFTARLASELARDGAPTFVIAANAIMASWAIQAFHALDLRCPEDLSLFALDEPDWAELVVPRLSCLRQPTHEMTQSAWDLLNRRIIAKNNAAPQRIVCHGQPIFRESVRRLPASPALSMTRAS